MTVDGAEAVVDKGVAPVQVDLGHAHNVLLCQGTEALFTLKAGSSRPRLNQGLLSLPLLSDVLDERQMARTLAGGGLNPGNRHADPDHGTIGTQIALVHLVTGNFTGVQPRHMVQ